MSLIDNDTEIVIRWRSATALSGSVRDAGGIWDCTWTADAGWSCSCGELRCVHSLALRQLASVATSR